MTSESPGYNFDSNAHARNISPTLAKFFHVPYHTKMHEEDVVLGIWKYINEKKLLIDNRTLLVDSTLQPVFHPRFFYKGYGDTEDSLIMIFIAKMHMDPEFICKDVQYHMEPIKRSFAASKIQNWYRKRKARDNSGTSKGEGAEWMSYLASHYGGTFGKSAIKSN